MIHTSIRYVHADKVARLREHLTMTEDRAEEVRETFRQEGVRQEQAYLLPTSDGAILVYVVDVADYEQAATVFENSTLPIDQEHKDVMAEVIAGSVDAELIFDLSV